MAVAPRPASGTKKRGIPVASRESGMRTTRQSLLLRAQAGDEGAWKDLADLYRPLIVGWLRRQGVPADEVDDLVQEILLAVVQSLPSFSHSGRRGAFRAWLRTIARNRTCDFWKAAAARRWRRRRRVAEALAAARGPRQRTEPALGRGARPLRAPLPARPDRAGVRAAHRAGLPPGGPGRGHRRRGGPRAGAVRRRPSTWPSRACCTASARRPRGSSTTRSSDSS